MKIQKQDQQSDYDYLTIKEFCKQYPTFTQGSIRNLIFKANSNGLLESGAIVKNSGIRINVPVFFQWYESHSTFGTFKSAA